ncbi:MAG: hypothetical protein IKK44_02400 [Clostridium sp.]|nr:hypothetical protein [Clostridium sp.]
MNENQEKKRNKMAIVGLLVLIAALVIGIKLIFAGLAAALPELPEQSSQSMDAGSVSQSAEADISTENDLPAPNFCPYCGDELSDSFQWGQFCPFCGEKVE